jgi:quercetin dioxygenase-like cupin family protein
MRVSSEGRQPAIEDSALAVDMLDLAAGTPIDVSASDADTIVLVGAPDRPHGQAHLVPAGEQATLGPEGGARVLRATIGPAVDHHAPLGPRESEVEVSAAKAESATGKRSFQVLFGPHNGSTRATMFVGYVPPGAAPWHFHLYDEIVWIWRGEGRFHTHDGAEVLAPGSAFRIRPREVHIVENTSATDELVVVGLFTPAGSPSAAYLAEAPA